MEVFGSFLVLLSLAVFFLWAVVGLINPAWARLPHRMMSVAVWALSVVLAVTGLSLSPSDDTGAATSATSSGVRTKGELTEEEKAQSEEIACRFDLQCWGDKHSLRAARPCQLAIENLALYDYEWTDGWLGAKFDRFAWKDREAGTIAYRGSEIKFQNAFGAWRRSSYLCDYDPNTQTVLDARVF